MHLPPFSPTARCPKCSHDTVNVAYSDGASHGPLGCAYSCPQRGHRREHLDRVCQRCHFQWPEAVLERMPPVDQEV